MWVYCSAAEPFALRNRDRNPMQYSSPVKAGAFPEITLNRCFISEVFFGLYPFYQTLTLFFKVQRSYDTKLFSPCQAFI